MAMCTADRRCSTIYSHPLLYTSPLVPAARRFPGAHVPSFRGASAPRCRLRARRGQAGYMYMHSRQGGTVTFAVSLGGL